MHGSTGAFHKQFFSRRTTAAAIEAA